MSVFFVGCGVYQPATGSRPSSGNNKPGNNPGTNPPGGEDPGGEDGPGNKPVGGYVFTVTLSNAPEVLPADMEAVWTNKNRNEVHSAKFEDGKAEVSGLNGEYHVTLVNLPADHTYDCNGYNVSNAIREITIELLTIIPTKKYKNIEPQGEKSFKFYEISAYGTYRATLKSASDAMGYIFKPTENGSFSFTSWCDVTANQINPILRLYRGVSESYCTFQQEINDGGLSGTFTKNFKFNDDFGDENLGASKMFAIKATVNNIDYPVYVDFTLKRDSDFELDDGSGEPVYANGPFATAEQRNPSGTWQYLYHDNVQVKDGTTYDIQDESKVVFNKTDGFYHVGSEDGPLLYAKITKDCQVFPTFDPMSEAWLNLGFTYFMVSLVCEGYNYAPMIRSGNGCYAEYCTSNADGAHPVNKELKEFLKAFASARGLFFDGEGTAERAELNKYEGSDTLNPDGINLQSDENSMWLFACGYYK